MPLPSDEIFQNKLEPHCKLYYVQCEAITMYTATVFIQEPVGFFLGDRRKWKGSGAKRRLITKRDFVYYIPILKTLEVLLNNKCYADEVCST